MNAQHNNEQYQSNTYSSADINSMLSLSMNGHRYLNDFEDSNIDTNKQISELIIPHTQQSLPILSPIIASLSQQNKPQWTTWITCRMPNKYLLEKMGANLSCLRIIIADSDEDVRWLVWQALAQGNSHTVVAENTAWTHSDIKAMQEAAEQGLCEALLVTVSNHY